MEITLGIYNTSTQSECCYSMAAKLVQFTNSRTKNLRQKVVSYFPLDDHSALISQNKEINYLYVTKFVDLTNSGNHNLLLYASPNPVIKSRPEITHQEFSKRSITGDGKSHPRVAYKPTLMADLKVFQEGNRIPKCKIDLLSRVNHQYLI